jgi:hypothetical protein
LPNVGYSVKVVPSGGKAKVNEDEEVFAVTMMAPQIRLT